MSHLMQPLRDEHQELLPHIRKIRTVADEVGTLPVALLRQDITETYEFLSHHLIPHAQAEERALYPIVGKLMGASEATATMIRDHVEIGRLIEELGTLRLYLNQESLGTSQEQALRRVLYGLSALIAVHFAKEEEVYVPLLEAHLTPAEAQHLFDSMEQAAHEAKGVVK